MSRGERAAGKASRESSSRPLQNIACAFGSQTGGFSAEHGASKLPFACRYFGNGLVSVGDFELHLLVGRVVSVPVVGVCTYPRKAQQQPARACAPLSTPSTFVCAHRYFVSHEPSRWLLCKCYRETNAGYMVVFRRQSTSIQSCTNRPRGDQPSLSLQTV